MAHRDGRAMVAEFYADAGIDRDAWIADLLTRAGGSVEAEGDARGALRSLWGILGERELLAELHRRGHRDAVSYVEAMGRWTRTQVRYARRRGVLPARPLPQQHARSRPCGSRPRGRRPRTRGSSLGPPDREPPPADLARPGRASRRGAAS